MILFQQMPLQILWFRLNARNPLDLSEVELKHTRKHKLLGRPVRMLLRKMLSFKGLVNGIYCSLSLKRLSR